MGVNGALTQRGGKADAVLAGPASVTCVSSEVLGAAPRPLSREAALCARRNAGFCRWRVNVPAHRSVVRVNQINNLCDCRRRRRRCFAFSTIARQMKYGEFCRCHFIRFRLLLITQNGGKGERRAFACKPDVCL